MIRRLTLILAALGLVTGSALAVAGAASATVTTVTGTTYIANHPDGGHGSPGTWAYDDFHRTVTVTLAATSDCTSMAGFNASTMNCYDATIADNGKFNAIVGNGAPNGTGVIKHAVQGSMVGHYALTVYAPSADTLTTANIPGYRNDNFGAPATTTTNWPTLAFTTATGVVTAGGAYNWTYTDQCEKWVDSSANNDGLGAAAGNITGQTLCVVSVTGPGLVKNAHSAKCMNITNGVYATGGTLNQYTCGAGWHGQAGGAQKFEYVQRSDGSAYLLAISPDNGSKWYVTSSVKGGQLSLKPWYTAGADAQYSGGYYKFVNTGLVADDAGLSVANGAHVIGWPFNGQANQRWSLP